MASAGTRLSSFDALRGIAILSVVAFHTAVFTPTAIPFINSLFDVGEIGVQLFFIISALTMCHMWEQRREEANRTAKFYVRRIMRIAPLFWLAAAFYIAVNGMGPSFWAHDGMTRSDVGLTMLFLHGFWPPAINNVVPGGWSIAVEMTFYLLFPLVIGVIGNRRHLYLALAGATFLAYHFWWQNWLKAALATGSFGGNPEMVSEFLYYNFLNQSPIFLIGCYLHFAFREGFTKREVIAIAMLSLTGIAVGHMLLTVAVGLSALVYLAVTQGMRSSLLENFGRNSFSVYLVHFIVVQVVGSILPGQTDLPFLLIRFAVVATISFALARFLHITVERNLAPVTKWLVAAIDRRHNQAAPA